MHCRQTWRRDGDTCLNSDIAVDIAQAKSLMRETWVMSKEERAKLEVALIGQSQQLRDRLQLPRSTSAACHLSHLYLVVLVHTASNTSASIILQAFSLRDI